jgi:hypothetical protein
MPHTSLHDGGALTWPRYTFRRPAPSLQSFPPSKRPRCHPSVQASRTVGRFGVRQVRSQHGLPPQAPAVRAGWGGIRSRDWLRRMMASSDCAPDIDMSRRCPTPRPAITAATFRDTPSRQQPRFSTGDGRVGWFGLATFCSRPTYHRFSRARLACRHTRSGPAGKDGCESLLANRRAYARVGSSMLKPSWIPRIPTAGETMLTAPIHAPLSCPAED